MFSRFQLAQGNASRRCSWRALVPSRCLVCHSWPSASLCPACVHDFAPACTRCSLCALPCTDSLCANCLQHPPPWDACFCAVSYGYPWSGLMAQFKFRDDPGLARPLAQLLLQRAPLHASLSHARFIIPIPLSDQRLRERGYNQAASLARALCAPKVDVQLLWRLHTMQRQAELGRAQRRHNLDDVFMLNPARAHTLAGSHCVLVDDVMTTGTTLEQATGVLRHAGVDTITCVVFARTPP